MPTADSASPAAPSPFYLVGDALCLDLLNTVVEGQDLLPDFDRYLRWLSEAGADAGGGIPAGVLARWRAEPSVTAATLASVKELRETLRVAVQAFAAGKRVPERVLAMLNPLLARSPARAELVRGTGEEATRLHKRFRIHWQEPTDLLAPIAESAADLFSGADPSLVRQCDGAGCTMLFLDRTKNHRRRWCSMAVCGNRAKVAAHRARQRTSSAARA